MRTSRLALLLSALTCAGELASVGASSGIFAWLVLDAPAWAEAKTDLVKQARSAYEDAEYGRAVELAHRALGQTLSREEKISALETMAFALTAQAKPGEAKAAFQRLLHVDATYQLPKYSSPKLRSALDDARNELKADLPIGEPKVVDGRAAAKTNLTVIPVLRPTAPRDGEPLEVSVAPHDPDVAKVVVYHRRRADSVAHPRATGAYSQVIVTAPPVSTANLRFATTIPGDQVRTPTLEYYLDLRDRNDRAIGGAGNANEPLLVDVLPRASKPVYKRAWFWGTIGGVVAAGTLAAILGTTLSGSGSSTSLATFKLH